MVLKEGADHYGQSASTEGQSHLSDSLLCHFDQDLICASIPGMCKQICTRMTVSTARLRQQQPAIGAAVAINYSYHH